jgi:hypothetical protein
VKAAAKYKAAESTSTALDTIRPLRMPDVTPAAMAGENAHLRWIPVSDLRINRAYQRDLTRKSVTLIRQMVATFDWARLKALSVLELGDGTYEVLDGQHTAIAAASHGGIPRLPCLVCAQRTVDAAAAAFVDLNTQRVNLSPMQIFFAQVAAGDELATDVSRGVRLGGGKIVPFQAVPGTWNEGDTMAIAAFRKLAKEGGVAYVRRVTAVGVKARLAPITRDFIVACRSIMWGQHAGTLSDERIVDLVRIHGMLKLTNKARVEMAKGGTLGDALARVLVRLG